MAKKGLILEGGAMRGLFTAGVMDVLMENHVTFDGAIGVSAGAVFGCNYKSEQIGRVLRYNTRFCNDPRYASFRSLLKTGDLYGADFCYHELPNKLISLIQTRMKKIRWNFMLCAPMCKPANRSITAARQEKTRTSHGCVPPLPCQWYHAS